MSGHLARSACLRDRGPRPARDSLRCADPPTPNPDKYADELLEAYLSIEDGDAFYAEYAAKGVTAWDTREFVVKDCDGRRLAFGSNL